MLSTGLQPEDVVMMAFSPHPTEKLPPFYLFSAETGDILAGPFDRVAKALSAARFLASQRGGRAWHKRTTPDAHGDAVTALYAIE